MGIRYRLKFNMSDGSQITAGEFEVPTGSGDGSYKLTEADITLIVQRVLAELNVYSGNYEVTPSAEEQQLPTAQAIMEQDLLIKEIPYSEVSNNKGGKTVNIG